MDPALVASVAAQLQGGSHPDLIHEVHAPKFVKMAIALIQAAEKEIAALEAAKQ